MKSSTKAQRLEAILSLVETTTIDGQDQLLKLLHQRGFTITQATLSRDINELKIVKIPDGNGGYRYSRHSTEQRTPVHSTAAGLVSIEVSGQMAVIHTRPGYASMMAATIDDAKLRGVMGTLAGDDTVLIILRQSTEPQAILAELQTILPDMTGKIIGI